MMRLGIVLALGSALWATVSPTAVQAGGFEVAEQGAPAAGTGNAGVARAEDAAAAWWNPAATADGKGFRGLVGATLVIPTLHGKAADGTWESDTDIGVLPPHHAYVSVADGPWAVGISVNLPYASRVRWPANWTERFEILESRPQFVRFAPYFAWSFGDLRIAAGPHIDMGTFEVRRGLDFVDDEGSVHMKLSGAGVGGDAALYLHASEWLDLGFTYRSRTVIKLDGDADFTTPLAFATTAPDQKVTSELTLPDKFVLGGAGTFGAVRVLLDLSLTLWSVNERYVFDFKQPQTPDRVQVNDWSSSFAVRAGGEYTVCPGWLVRLGAFYDMSPVPEKTLAPSAPDSDRVGVTVGTGLAWNGFGLDVAYGLTVLTGADSASADAPAATYDGTIHNVSLSASYRQ